MQTDVPRRPAQALALAALIMLMTACGSNAAAPSAGESAGGDAAPTSVTIMYPAISPPHYPLWIAEDIGAFENYGIDANLVFVQGGIKAAQGLLSGSAPFVYVSGADVLNLAAEGSDAVVLMAFGDRPTDAIVGAKGIDTPEKLKGKVVGINDAGSETDFTMRYALEQMGLVPDTDVSIVTVGGESVRLAAVLADTVQASVIEATRPEIADEGLPILYNFLESDVKYMKSAIVTTKAYVDANPQIVEGVVKGLLEGVAYYKNHPDESISIAAKYSATTNLAGIQASYDLLSPLLPYVPLVQEDGLKTVQEWSPESTVKDVDVSTVYDNSILEKLQESGFTDSIQDR